MYLAQGLQERGHDVLFFASPRSKLRALAPSIAWRDLPEKRRYWRKTLEEALPEGEAVIVHAFHNKAVKTLAWCGLLWQLSGRPVACVAHRGVIFPPTNILPYVLPGIGLFAVNSQACLDTLPLLWRKSAGCVVYNCVPDEKIRPARSRDEVRAELELTGKTTLIGCVSNNSPNKGLEVLIKSFAKIYQPGRVLCLVGGDSQLWSPLCTQLGIIEAVRMIPRTEAVADYLQLMDLFVLPSFSESSPNTLLEAMRMGLPAVCSHVGGVPECIHDKRCLVPPGDVDALAQAVELMLTTPGALEEAAARNLAFSERFKPEQKLERMEKLYADLLRPWN